MSEKIAPDNKLFIKSPTMSPSSRSSSPDELAMSKIISEDIKMKKKKASMVVNITTRIKEINNDIRRYKAKIANLQKKKDNYERLHEDYNEDKSSICIIL
jgi:hypothetical protein